MPRKLRVKLRSTSMNSWSKSMSNLKQSIIVENIHLLLLAPAPRLSKLEF